MLARYAAWSAELKERPIPLSASAPSLRVNFAWTFAGNLCYVLCQWSMISVLTKLGSPAVVGQFALALAITAPVFMLTNLQLRAVQAADARSEHSFAEYFTLRFSATAVGLLVVSALVMTSTTNRPMKAVILLVALAKSAESQSDVVAGLLQKEERLDLAAISLILRGTVSALGFGVAFAIFRSLTAATVAMVGTWSAVLVFFDLYCAAKLFRPGDGFWDFKPGRLLSLFVTSLPLGIVMALLSLGTNIPRYVLQYFRGSAELGIFASLAYLIVSVNLVVNALGQSATTRLSRMFAERKLDEVRSLLRKLVMLGILIVVVGVPAGALLGRAVLTLLYRPEYGEHVELFVAMIVATGIGAVGSFLGYGATAARCFRAQVPAIAASTLTVGAGSILLVPRFGAGGAAVAVVASAIVLVLAYSLVLSGALKSFSETNE